MMPFIGGANMPVATLLEPAVGWKKIRESEGNLHGYVPLQTKVGQKTKRRESFRCQTR